MSSDLSSKSNVYINDKNDTFNNQLSAKRRGKGAVYDFYAVIPFRDFMKNFDAKINCKGLVQVFRFDQNIYKYKFKRQLKEDMKFYYQCSPLNESCPVSSYLTIKNDNVSIFIENESHEHSGKNERGISDEVKIAINKLYYLGVKSPKTILRSLEKQGLSCPSKHQLQNYLVRLRKSNIDSKEDSVDASEELSQSQSEIHLFQRDFYVDLSLYSASYEWISTIKNENIIEMKHEDKIYFYTSMLIEKPLTKENAIEFVNANDQFCCHAINGQFSKIAITYLDQSKWQNSTCNCGFFYKQFICHHIIGLAYKYKLIEIPYNAKYTPDEHESDEGKHMLFDDEDSLSSS